MEELFPLVDETGKVTGSATRKFCHSGSFVLHPVIHLHVFNNRGELYLQKRAPTKDIQPGKWDTSVGGHVDFHETETPDAFTTRTVTGLPEWVYSALKREASEELGLHSFQPTFVTKYVFESPFEKELVHTFFAITNEIPQPDPGEISEGRFWKIDEIKNALNQNVFTPNFEGEILSVLEKFEQVRTN